MHIVKARKVGNSTTITLPHELATGEFAPGNQVLVDKLPSGEIVLRPMSDLRALIRQAGRRVIAEDREALEILANS